MRYVRGPAVSALALFLLLAGAVTACGADGSVSGTFHYRDKRFDGDPPVYQDTQLLPIRAAVVKVYLSDYTVCLGTGVTLNDGENDGAYTVSFEHYDGSEAVNVVLRCYAKTDPVRIQVKTGAEKVHFLETDVIKYLDPDVDTGGKNFVAEIGDGAGAFNVFDCCLAGYEYIDAATNKDIPNLTVYWPAAAGVGSCYNDWDIAVYIQGGAIDPDDPDEFDDAVIIHEFGHFVAFQLARDDSPGGWHSLQDHLDPRLAWSEGWASFYSSAVRGNRYYWDSIEGDMVGLRADLEDISSFPSGAGSDNEVAVAAVLWDIIDGYRSAEAFDTIERDFAATVWNVMENYFPGAARATTLETFWDGWFAQGYGNLAKMEAIFGAREIEYVEDAREDDDARANAAALSVGSIVHHTYYPAEDVDWTVFDVVRGKSYVIETVDLKNAADTVLELYKSGEESYEQIHDDRNRYGGDQSSRIEFTPIQSGTYAVKSYAYAKNTYEGADTDALVRYGSYDVKLSYYTSTAAAGALQASPESGTAPLPVSFTASVTGMIPTAYFWDFAGNGTYDSITDSGSASWTYTEYGTYTAAITVSDADATSVQAEVEIVVSQAADAPTVTASASPAVPYYPGTVIHLSGEATAAGTKVITKYEWDLDGDRAYDWAGLTNGDTWYIYETVGTYRLRFTATDSADLASSADLTIEILEPSDVRVWIVQPADGAVVGGNALTVRANTAPAEDTASVRFWYRPAAVGSWLELGPAILPPPYSFATTWDTTGLDEGLYELKAVATDAADQQTASEWVTVKVAGTDVEEKEDIVDGLYERRQRVNADRKTMVWAQDGTLVTVPYRAVSTETILTVRLLRTNPHPTSNENAFAKEFRAIGLESGALEVPAGVRIPYQDDGNGIVDGMEIQVGELWIYRFDEDANEWQPLIECTVNTTEKYVECETPAFSDFALAKSGLGAIAVKGSSGGGGGGGCFLRHAAGEFPRSFSTVLGKRRAPSPRARVGRRIMERPPASPRTRSETPPAVCRTLDAEVDRSEH